MASPVNLPDKIITILNDNNVDVTQFQNELNGLDDDRKSEVNDVLDQMATFSDTGAVVGIATTAAGLIPIVGGFLSAGGSVFGILINMFGPSMGDLINGLREEFKTYVDEAIIKHDIVNQVKEIGELSYDLKTFLKGVSEEVYNTPADQYTPIRKLYDDAKSLSKSYLWVSDSALPVKNLMPFVSFLLLYQQILMLSYENAQKLDDGHANKKGFMFEMENYIPHIFTGYPNEGGFKEFLKNASEQILKDRIGKIAIANNSETESHVTTIKYYIEDKFDGKTKQIASAIFTVGPAIDPLKGTVDPLKIETKYIVIPDESAFPAKLQAFKDEKEKEINDSLDKLVRVPFKNMENVEPFKSMFAKAGVSLS